MQNSSHIENKIYQSIGDYDNPRMLKILLTDQKVIQAIENDSNILQGVINHISVNPPRNRAFNSNYEEILSLVLKADNQRSKLLWAITQVAKSTRIEALKLLLAADNQHSNLQNIIIQTTDVDILQLLLATIKKEELQAIDLSIKINQACKSNDIATLTLLLEADNHRSNLNKSITYAYANNLPEILKLLLQENNSNSNFDLQDAFNTTYENGFKEILQILVTSMTPAAMLKIDLLPLIAIETYSLSDSIEILSLLLQADNRRSDLGELIKHTARSRSCHIIEKFKLLLQADNGRSDLRHSIVYATFHYSSDMLSLLLQFDKQQTDLEQIIYLVKLVTKIGRSQFLYGNNITTKHYKNKLKNDCDFNEFKDRKCISVENYNEESLELLQKAAEMQLLCKKFPTYCKYDSLATLTLYSLARREAIDLSCNSDDKHPTELFNAKDKFIEKAEKVINYITDIKK